MSYQAYGDESDVEGEPGDEPDVLKCLIGQENDQVVPGETPMGGYSVVPDGMVMGKDKLIENYDLGANTEVLDALADQPELVTEFAWTNAKELALGMMREERKGKVVIDCGATKTFGSLLALEDLLDVQKRAGLALPGRLAAEVGVNDRPRFGFPNGETATIC